jgi:tetratricopeptide (TPR) repeat protein
MISAQQGDSDAAIEDFKQALQLRPAYEIALLNLGNVYRRRKDFGKAEECLTHALELRPDDPDINYSIGMLNAQQNQLQAAATTSGVS